MRGRRDIVLLGLLLTACLPSSATSPVIPTEPTGPLVIGDPQSASDEDGAFRLTITSDQDRYRAGQRIEVSASLTFLGPADAISAAGSGTLVGFGVQSIDLGVDIRPLFTGDCAAQVFRRDEPVPYPFAKSGGMGQPGDPLAPFLTDYFSSPDLRLPAGTWTISAMTTVYKTSCSDPSSLSASLTVAVEP